MPRYPKLADWTTSVRHDAFAPLLALARASKKKIYPLHVGDSYMPPPPSVIEALRGSVEGEGSYRYGIVDGEPSIREKLAQRLVTHNRIDTNPSRVFVTAGATQGLFAGASSLFGPGDEVLIPAPHYPLTVQAIASVGAVPVPVPFYDLVDQGACASDILTEYVTERTAGVCLTNPNNPDGTTLSRSVLEDVAQFLAERDLWAISDESYELVRYSDAEPHVSLASLPGADSRTVSLFSFSKAFGLAGLRIGYATVPKTLAPAMHTALMVSSLHPSRPAQVAAEAALSDAEVTVPARCKIYESARDTVCSRMPVPMRTPTAGCYAFFDVSDFAAATGGLSELYTATLEATGVLLAPGAPFGAAYENHARICFSSADNATVSEAIERLESFWNTL